MKTNTFKSRSVGKVLTAGVETTIYTCPNNYTAHVVLLFVCNKGSGNKTVNVKWYNVHENTEYCLLGGYIVSAYGFLKMDGSYLTLNAGDQLRVMSEVDSTMDAVVTVEEYYDPTSRQ